MVALPQEWCSCKHGQEVATQCEHSYYIHPKQGLRVTYSEHHPLSSTDMGIDQQTSMRDHHEPLDSIIAARAMAGSYIAVSMSLQWNSLVGCHPQTN